MVFLLVAETGDADPPPGILDWRILDLGSWYAYSPTVRGLDDASTPQINTALGYLARGDLLSVALVRELPALDRLWLAFEFHRRLVIGKDLPHVEGLDLTSWRVVHDHEDFVVWEFCADRGAGVRIIDTVGGFRQLLLSAEPVAISISEPEHRLTDQELFGAMTDREGGAAALLSLSGARPGLASILLRNPAALELDYTLSAPGSIASMIASDMLSVAAVGLSSATDVSSLPGLAAFRDPVAAEQVWARSDRSAAQFWVLAEVSAGVDPRVVIPPGHIFEQQQVNGVQTLAASFESSFTLDPGQVQPVAIPAWCLNADLRPPTGQSVRSTPLRARYQAGQPQEDVWQDRQRILSRPW